MLYLCQNHPILILLWRRYHYSPLEETEPWRGTSSPSQLTQLARCKRRQVCFRLLQRRLALHIPIFRHCLCFGACTLQGWFERRTKTKVRVLHHLNSRFIQSLTLEHGRLLHGSLNTKHRHTETQANLLRKETNNHKEDIMTLYMLFYLPSFRV